jgi:hypothetical protein
VALIGRATEKDMQKKPRSSRGFLLRRECAGPFLAGIFFM